MARVALWTGLLMLAAGALAATAWLAARERGETSRCPRGLAPMGPRCCAPGQTEHGGRCTGRPRSCPLDMQRLDAGCTIRHRVIELAGGTLLLGPSDWEAEGRVEPDRRQVPPFRIDATEVTVARWRACADAGACTPITTPEPGRPVTGVAPEEAAGFCRHAGGRLPTGDEWRFAAMGAGGRRFPWGRTGLVCRRASYGLERGPCAEGATGPELAGARPDGASPEGALDLVGNVAEWTREPDGHAVARGGSYRSRVAAELKGWSSRAAPAPAADIGFRCAYGVGER